MNKRLRQFECVNNPDDFCNVCGKHMTKKQVKVFTETLQKHYSDYFGALPTLNEPWAPSMLCIVCFSNLHQWAAGQFSFRL